MGVAVFARDAKVVFGFEKYFKVGVNMKLNEILRGLKRE